jgi:hypothetical protein
MALIKLPAKPKKKFRNRPKLLLHGSIPRPLSGVNPRSIMGKQWWDEQRQKAYAHNNFHCHCCGVHKSEAKMFQWLEGHEIYKVDYKTYRTKFMGVVALCHCCHGVVHAGRTTQVYLNEKLSTAKFNTILHHGQDLIKKAKLDTPISFRFMELVSTGMFVDEANLILRKEYKKTAPLDLSSWDKWRLYFNGRLYLPKHKSNEDWSKYYHGE